MIVDLNCVSMGLILPYKSICMSFVNTLKLMSQSIDRFCDQSQNNKLQTALSPTKHKETIMKSITNTLKPSAQHHVH